MNALTFDVEDFFHSSSFDSVVRRSEWRDISLRVGDSCRHLLDIVDEYGYKATFFVLAWVAERDRELVREIAWRGHEIASHGYGHELVYHLTPETFREDVRRSKVILEDIIGLPVHGYRAPSFSITKSSLWALDVLFEEGYLYDSSIFPIHHDRYGIPSAPRFPYQAESGLIEFPLSTIELWGLRLPIAGGGYFRLFPVRWFAYGFKRLNQEGHPGVFYLHPWEIDEGQPNLGLRGLTRLRHTFNISRVPKKLRTFLNQFPFTTIWNVLFARMGG